MQISHSQLLFFFQMMSNREGQNWPGHMGQLAVKMEKETSPAPASTASTPAPAPMPDPDTPLNLTKPKFLSGTNASSSPGSDSHSTGAGSSGQQEQPLAATAPKLFSPGLPLPRNYLNALPHAGLPPHLPAPCKLYWLCQFKANLVCDEIVGYLIIAFLQWAKSWLRTSREVRLVPQLLLLQ